MPQDLSERDLKKIYAICMWTSSSLQEVNILQTDISILNLYKKTIYTLNQIGKFSDIAIIAASVHLITRCEDFDACLDLINHKTMFGHKVFIENAVKIIDIMERDGMFKISSIEASDMPIDLEVITFVDGMIQCLEGKSDVVDGGLFSQVA